MIWQILLDENISPEIACQLCELGHYVLAVPHIGLDGWPDWKVMDWCVERDFAICTKNISDFLAEHERYRRMGREHAGVLLCDDWLSNDVFRALSVLVRDVHPLEVRGRTRVLTVPPCDLPLEDI